LGRHTNAPPPQCHILISATCEYIILYDKKGSKDVIRYKDIKMKTLPWIIRVGAV
jgi:hypothetical protein